MEPEPWRQPYWCHFLRSSSLISNSFPTSTFSPIYIPKTPSPPSNSSSLGILFFFLFFSFLFLFSRFLDKRFLQALYFLASHTSLSLSHTHTHTHTHTHSLSLSLSLSLFLSFFLLTTNTYSPSSSPRTLLIKYFLFIFFPFNSPYLEMSVLN